MANAAMGFDEAENRPTYRMTIGRPGRSRALEVAERTGLPAAVLDRSRELLGQDHLELHRWLERLENLESELLEERGELARQRGHLAELERQAETEIERHREAREMLPEELARERERLRRRAKKLLDEALERLDRAVEEREEMGRRRRQQLRDLALDLHDEAPAPPAAPDTTLEPGRRVRVSGLGREGVVEEVRGSRAKVAVDGKHVWLSVGELEAVATAPRKERRSTVQVTTESDPESELMLIGMDSELARDELERFLDRALTAGRARVRVVHGHGAGVLRQMVAEVCRSHPAVRAFRHPPQSRGGTGATEIEL
jgi:DNA mismatch repair protein MutS2